MLKNITFILVVFAGCFFPVYADTPPETLAPQATSIVEPLKNEDHILICAPHPDDETIGCAGLIQQALGVGAKVKVVYLTNGDANQLAFMVYEKRLTFKKSEFIHMGEVRRKEAIKAMKLLGLSEDNLIFLGYPDFGTFKIFSQYWSTQRSYKSILTRVKKVPYKENFSYGAPYIGVSVLDDLKKIILEFQPNKIFVSHPADTNVDHRAFYLFLQVALQDLRKTIKSPRIYPYLVHCVGWPLPRHYHPELTLEAPHNFFGTQINWLKLELTTGQLKKKYEAILKYKSQTESSAFYLLSFARKNELFGDYPQIQLEKQASLKEKAVSFFGFSKMFEDSSSDFPGALKGAAEDKGQISYAVVDNSFLIHVENPKELNSRYGMQVYIFGYSETTPFAQMPKLRIISKHKKFRVFDKRTRINPDGISLDLKSNDLTLKVPLEILGNPDFILTSMKAYGETLPVDATGFRKIEIR
ncbi:MAG: PIG-L family deacetylase [Candidatus Omnitrophota bacterium]